jgi:DNA-binding NarL/FixJ family response regulator
MKKRALPALVRKSVFVVDDHPVFRAGLIQLIQMEFPHVDICGEANNAVEGLEKLLKVRCDLVIVEIALPGRSGLELARDIHAMRPHMSVIVISAFDELLYAERALASHARGYIMKYESPSRIAHALRTVLAGDSWFSERVSAKLFDVITGRTQVSAASNSLQRLSDRELEILRLIGMGKRNAEIAGELSLSPKTVDVHRCHIREKLGLNSGPELVCYAVHWVISMANRSNAST